MVSANLCNMTKRLNDNSKCFTNLFFLVVDVVVVAITEIGIYLCAFIPPLSVINRVDNLHYSRKP